MYECKRDEIQLKVSFFSFLFDYSCYDYLCASYIYVYIYIYTWVSEACTLLSLAALTNIQHRRCTNPEFMSEGEQSSERGPEHWMVAIKIGTTHGEPLSAGDLFCSDKMHITLILQWLWHNAGLSLSLFLFLNGLPIWSMACHHVSTLWEMSRIKLTKTHNTSRRRTLQECNSNDEDTLPCKNKKISSLKSRWTNNIFQ